MSTLNELQQVQFTLREVAEATGFPLVPLQRDCRAGRVEHVYRSRKRFMTMEQVLKLVDQSTVRVAPGAGAPTAVAGEGLDAYREKVRARLTRKQGRAA